MGLEHLVDVSSYLLMEDSADSEVEFVRSGVTPIGGGGHGRDGSDSGDDDDAESCSWDTSEVSVSYGDEYDDRDSSNRWNSLSQRSSVVWASDQEDGHVSLDVDQEEESWVDSGGRSGGGKVSKEEIDAMEDKVFWETCMAIGYP